LAKRKDMSTSLAHSSCPFEGADVVQDNAAFRATDLQHIRVGGTCWRGRGATDCGASGCGASGWDASGEVSCFGGGNIERCVAGGALALLAGGLIGNSKRFATVSALELNTHRDVRVGGGRRLEEGRWTAESARAGTQSYCNSRVRAKGARSESIGRRRSESPNKKRGTRPRS
jgi:hypothetical protein